MVERIVNMWGMIYIGIDITKRERFSLEEFYEI
jgi:hypothetical protein